jgi:hypothetical protein
MAKTTLLSFGAGQDSWALLLKYVHDENFRRAYAPHDFLVAMSDTGAEHPETYDFVEYVRAFCDRHGIAFTHITPDLGYHTGDWANGLLGIFEAKSIITSAAFPMSSCTASLKIAPLYKWLNAEIGRRHDFPVKNNKKALTAYATAFNDKIDVLIGFAVGEESRAGLLPTTRQLDLIAPPTCEDTSPDPPWMQQSINKRFPLIDLGLDRTGAVAYIESLGERVPYPSACYACHWKSDFDTRWTQLKYPDLFARWVSAEATKLRAWASEDFRRARQRPEKFKPNGVYVNRPVGGKMQPGLPEALAAPITLLDRAASATAALTRNGLVNDHAQLAYLDARRLREGHGVRSRAA